MTDTPNSSPPAAFAFEQAQLDAMRLNGQHFVYTKDTEIAAMLAICGYRLKSPKNDYVMETKAGKKVYAWTFYDDVIGINLPPPYKTASLKAVMQLIAKHGEAGFASEFPDCMLSPLLLLRTTRNKFQQKLDACDHTYVVFLAGATDRYCYPKNSPRAKLFREKGIPQL